MTHEPQLPQESDAQEIGQKAEDALHANRPLQWRLTPLTGTNDFGLDYQVQIIIEGKVKHVFRLQLKGTTGPKFNVSHEFLSLPLKTSTINFYERIPEPILLVLCDLSHDPTNPAKCPLYYVWAHGEIERLGAKNEEHPSTTDTRNIRFPTANLVTHDLDISSVLNNYLRLHRTVATFDQAVELKIPEFTPDQRAQLLRNLSEQISCKGRGFAESLYAPGTTPWPEAPRDSIAWKLSKAHQKTEIGATDEAATFLRNVEQVYDQAVPVERAEYWFLWGRIKSLTSDEKGALNAFQNALKEAPD